MGFFNTLKSTAETGMKKLEEFNEDVQKYMEKYEHLSKEELRKKGTSMFASNAEKGAIAKIMKNNGWRW